MNSKELRIGNWIKTMGRNPALDDLMELSPELLLDIAVMERRNIPVPYQPVPLTEEWLKKFGLRHDGYINSAKRWMGFAGNQPLVAGNGYYTILGYFGICEIRYVHQLQNLYRGLTGDELLPKNPGKPEK